MLLNSKYIYIFLQKYNLLAQGLFNNQTCEGHDERV